jgi:hypothetical protein
MTDRGGKERIVRGTLATGSGGAFIMGDDGAVNFFGDRIWRGYLRHWEGRGVCARRLPQLDYETGKRIIIMWPREEGRRPPYMELYYNERLVKYPASIFGHNAININGTVFNFSHLMNENEVISAEEYFYRPALGEFAPSPETGRFNVTNPSRPYYDKFGRIFMRTIHVLHVEGVDVERIMKIFRDELDIIRKTPPGPRRPDKYRDFNFLNRSCTTIIRDGLSAYGFKNIHGIFPRDMFVSAAHAFLSGNNRSVTARAYMMKQLEVDESPRSALTPLLNPLNVLRVRRIYER